VLPASVVHAQEAGATLPVSLARIRAALAAPPPRLSLPQPTLDVPTFRAEVTRDLFEPAPIVDATFDPTWGLPSAGELMMSGVGKLGTAVGDYRRGRAKRRARKEVDDALADFCAERGCTPPAASRGPR
jgi:hypothetical protein